MCRATRAGEPWGMTEIFAMHPTAPPATPPAVWGRALAKTYTSSAVSTLALAGVDVQVQPGESVAIMGPSGSGKTTLLHVLAGILTPDSGEVMVSGLDLVGASDAVRTRLRREAIGFVFQSGQLLPELPAVENVALPLMLAGHPRRRAQQRAAELLGMCGLAGLEDRRPGELSGGQAQRVAIARSLVGQPSVVFADEPTGALDQTTGAEVMHTLTGMCRQLGAALVLVTHDPHVAGWCSRTLHMRDGQIISEERR